MPTDTAPVPELPAAEFREAMGHFATGVTVVTSVDADGEPVGTTANAVTSLSLDPPLVLVCFDLGSQTLRAIRGHGAFVVNVLAAPQQHLSRNFARRASRRPGRESSTGAGRPAALGSRMCSRSWSAPWSTHCPAAITRSSSAASATWRPARTPAARWSSSAAATRRSSPPADARFHDHAGFSVR
jgi:flavin reductase (DIM6/NTAB) family NADH-FMN oxidoreductase RutF